VLDSSDWIALAILGPAGVLCLLLEPGRRRAAWFLWMGALVAVTVPFGEFRGQPNWANVGWIPFQSPPLKASDIAANLLLYLPFGFLAPAGDRRRRLGNVVLWGLGAAALLSTTTETSQLFSHTRFSSSTDVVCNVIGASMGLLVAYATRYPLPRDGGGPSVRSGGDELTIGSGWPDR
jgi:glycopeptide antibiotics resistance protein